MPLPITFGAFVGHCVFPKIRSLLAIRGVHNDRGSVTSQWRQCSDCFFGNNEEALHVMLSSLFLHQDFINEKEELLLLEELEPYLKRLRYETSHWDDAIHGYRETEKSKWNSENMAIIQRVRDKAFSADDQQLVHVHVLDIKKDGYIKPHVDSVRFCGDTIAGLSLLSSSIMRLTREEDKNKSIDVLLKRRSLYIMTGEARFKYTHEILPDDQSHFKGIHIPRDRRISVICRNHPRSTAKLV